MWRLGCQGPNSPASHPQQGVGSVHSPQAPILPPGASYPTRWVQVHSSFRRKISFLGHMLAWWQPQQVSGTALGVPLPVHLFRLWPWVTPLPVHLFRPWPWVTPLPLHLFRPWPPPLHGCFCPRFSDTGTCSGDPQVLLPWILRGLKDVLVGVVMKTHRGRIRCRGDSILLPLGPHCPI